MIAEPTIFVIDDDQAVLSSMRRLLNTRGFDTQTFDSAEAFSASADPNEGLCLVLDVNLSGRSGIELCRELAASGSSLPVIFFTGNDTDRLRKEAMGSGCVAYLKKPFRAQLLLDAIDQAAALRKCSAQDPTAMSRNAVVRELSVSDKHR